MMKRLALILLVPLTLVCQESFHFTKLINIDGEVFYGRKLIPGKDVAPTFRKNRPIGGFNGTLGILGLPLKIKATTSMIPESFVMTDVTITEKGYGLQAEYHHGDYTLYAGGGEMQISMTNNHVGKPSDHGKGYWADLGCRKYRKGKLDIGVQFRYSTGDDLLFVTDLAFEPDKVFFFDMGGYSLSITLGVNEILESIFRKNKS